MTTALSHDEMVAAVKSGYIAIAHTLGTGQDAGFKQGMREKHREVLSTMYDNLIVFHRPRIENAVDGRWTQERLDGSVVVHQAESIACPKCDWKRAVWADEATIRLTRHLQECPAGVMTIEEFKALVEAQPVSQAGTPDE